MNPWAVLGTVVGIIALMFAIFIQLTASIDKKIEIKLKDPEFIRMVAKEVRWPFAIFDEDNSVIVNGGAMDYIEKIQIKMDNRKEVSEIIISPKNWLAVAPILESIDAFVPFEDAIRGNKFDFIYKRIEMALLVADRPSKQLPKKKFRLQLIISP